MQSGQPAVYTSQPGMTNLPIELPTLSPNGGDQPANMLLVVAFAIWLLRQPGKHK